MSLSLPPPGLGAAVWSAPQTDPLPQGQTGHEPPDSWATITVHSTPLGVPQGGCLAWEASLTSQRLVSQKLRQGPWGTPPGPV